MKRIIAFAVFAMSFLAVRGYAFEPSINIICADQQQNDKWTKGYVYERAKKMFRNIPDHCQVSPSVRKVLFTEELYSALEKAWNVPHWYNGIGDEDFLYYFISGNDGDSLGPNSITSTTVQSVENNTCTVLIKYREYYQYDNSYSSTTEERSLVLVYINDEWYLDDFSVGEYIPSVKARCKKYIQKEISDYQSGETLRRMKAESYTSQEITNVNSQFNAFLKKYGSQVSGSGSDLISYNAVSIRPTFNDGDLDTFVKWILSRVKYPEHCVELKIEGDLKICFTIDENGFLVDEKVVKSVEPSLDDEVMRYVTTSPQWAPGKEYGNAIKTVVELTVPLRINGTSSSLSSVSMPAASSKQSATTSFPTSSGSQIVEESVEAIPYQTVEVKPSFNGGDANDFSKWVNSRLVYPKIAFDNGVQGLVRIQFIVNADGQVINVKVLRGVDSSLDKEAVRVVSSSPKWTPGKQGGKNVAVSLIFPVFFQLR